MQSVIGVRAERSSAVGNQGRVRGSREAKRRDSTGPAGALNRAYIRGAIELELAFAEVAEARLIHRGGADGGGVGDVDLLGARGVDAGKVAGGGAGGHSDRGGDQDTHQRRMDRPAQQGRCAVRPDL